MLVVNWRIPSLIDPSWSGVEWWNFVEWRFCVWPTTSFPFLNIGRRRYNFSSLSHSLPPFFHMGTGGYEEQGPLLFQSFPFSDLYRHWPSFFFTLLKEYINPPRVDTNRHLTKTLVSPGFTYFFLTDRLLELNRWPLEWWKLDVSLKGIQRYINNRCWNNHNHHDNGKKKVSSRLAWCVWMRACRRHCWKRIGAWTMLRVRPISIKK